MNRPYKKKLLTKEFDANESKYLLEEFTFMLAEIMEYIEEREDKIISLENQLHENARIRNMLKATMKKLLFYIPNKINTFRK